VAQLPVRQAETAKARGSPASPLAKFAPASQ
jgi:hypothetical protein